MPKLIHKLRSVLNGLRETLFKGLFRARFRYDVFISYSHRDAKEYAANLKKQLNNLDFSCFIDEEESPPGLSLDPTLAKALKKSAVLVLLATERALTRPYIVSEFEKFASTERTIVPINILGALTKNEEEALKRSPWKIINERKLVWIDETDEAFDKKNPSPPIADGIDKLFKYTRRNVRVRAEIIGTAVLVLLAAFGAGFVIKGQAEQVTIQTQRAKDATAEADNQTRIARDAERQAQTQLAIAAQATTEAEKQQRIAADARTEAERQQKIAFDATREAKRQQAIADAARAEADRQLTIAQARQLANHAELARGIDSDNLFSSTSIAKRSLEMRPTLEGDLAVRQNVSLLPLLARETQYQGKLGAVAVSPNATAIGFLTANSEVEIRREGKEVVRRSRPANHRCVALSNDGSYFATAGGNSALIQNTDTRDFWEVANLDIDGIRAIALSREGKYLAMIAMQDEGLLVSVWERDGQKSIGVGTAMRGSLNFIELRTVAFSSDKEELLAAGGDESGVRGFLRTWLIRKEQATQDECLKDECKGKTRYSLVLQSSLLQPALVTMVAITSKDAHLITANEHTALVWKKNRLDDYEQTARIAVKHPLAVAFNTGARHVYVVSQPTGWRKGDALETDKTLRVWEASGLGAQFQATRDRDQVDITKTRQTCEDYGRDEKTKCDVSDDGSYLAAANEQSVVRVLDLTQNVPFENVVTSSRFRSLESIELSWDGQFMALGGTGNDNRPKVIVYQRQKGSYGEFSKPLSLPAGTTFDILALSPDGRRLATTTPKDHHVIIWNVQTGSDITPPLLRDYSQVRAIIFSPNGELIAAMNSEDETIISTVSTGKSVATGKTRSIDPDARHNVAFSRDGRFFAIGNSDGTARVFQVSTGEELMRLQHDDPVTAVSFSRDGNYLATATEAVALDTAGDQAYRSWTWLLLPQDLIAETCKRLPRVCEIAK